MKEFKKYENYIFVNQIRNKFETMQEPITKMNASHVITRILNATNQHRL